MFLSKYFFLIIKNSKRLSVSSAGACLLALLVALFGSQLAFLVPEDWAEILERDALYEVLRIVSSSMLLVVTFSLSTMVSAYVAASEGVTPRAAKLLMEDQSSQRTLSIFLSAFIFSIATLTGLSTTYYQDREIFVLFVLTIGLIGLVVWTIIGWIERLSKLGRVHETIRRVELSTQKAMSARIDDVDACYTHYDKLPDNLKKLTLSEVGYLQSVGYSSLDKIAKENELSFYLCVQPGSFLTEQTIVAHIDFSDKSKLSDDLLKDIKGCFALGSSRYFQNDPRFGLITLSEVASRALSPAINDPGTAIDVIGSMIRLFSHWDKKLDDLKGQTDKSRRVQIPQLEIQDFYEDIVRSLSRDGAAHIEVTIRLYKAIHGFSELKEHEFHRHADEYKKIILSRANSSLPDDADKDLLQSVADHLRG